MATADTSMNATSASASVAMSSCPRRRRPLRVRTQTNASNSRSPGSPYSKVNCRYRLWAWLKQRFSSLMQMLASAPAPKPHSQNACI
ncbi:hypothetical protein D3C78_1791170 [compost metagenome]